MIYFNGFSQREVSLHIHQPLLPWHLSDSVVVDLWKYYLCHLSCNRESAHECILIMADTVVQLNCYDEPNTQLTLQIGIDSSQQAHPNYTGDLNPIHNMYWTWQSGYIQLKAEGKILRDNGIWEDFQWHLGGYRYYPTDRKIQHLITANAIDFVWDEKLLAQILQLNPTQQIMSESKEASELMTRITQCITFR